MPLLRMWAVRTAGYRRSLLLLLELLLATLSGRAAWMLIRDQRYFDRHPGSFQWLEGISAQEWRWGTLVGIGAFLLFAGLALLTARRSQWLEDASFLLRQAGWACTAVFWCSLGGSLLAWNPDTFTSWLAVSVGLINVGMMLHGPFTWRDGGGS